MGGVGGSSSSGGEVELGVVGAEIVAMVDAGYVVEVCMLEERETVTGARRREVSWKEMSQEAWRNLHGVH